MLKIKPRINSIELQLIFCLWSAQGFVAFIWLLVLPTSARNEVALGFSAARLVMLGSILLLTGGSIALFVKSSMTSARNTWLDPNKRPLLWDLIYLVSIAVSLLSPAFILILYNLKGDIANVSYATRLSPLIFWAMLSGVELAIFLAFKRREGTAHVFQQIHPLFRNVFIVLVLLLSLGVLIGVTKIGITPDRNWGASAIPFLEWQILLVLVASALLTFFPGAIPGLNEKWVVPGIYAIALIFWLSQPVNPAYTATPPRAPNFEIYPFSDPLVYAQYAQAALVGNGFLWPEVPARPFYVACLTWLHLLGNQSYNNVILLQTLALGFFPVLLYLLGKAFGGRPLGLGLAILTIFRDINANVTVQYANNVTYSKLFLSELPTALLICLITLTSIQWIRRVKRPLWLPFLTGGILGAATLVRSQCLVLLAVIVLMALFIIPTRRQWLIASGCLLLGSVIVLSPWLARNYIATGGLILDNPLTQTMTMTRRWAGSEGNEILPRLSNETDAEYSNRMMKEAINILKRNPGFVSQTAANHFLNSEIGSLLAFPVRDEILSPAELLWPRHVFWKTPLTTSQLPLFSFNLLLFSIGVVTAYRHHRLIGLLPLGFGLAYNFWSAVFFTSGERFIVPVDWSIHLYQLFGLLILGGLILLFTHKAKERVSTWLLKPYADRSDIDESEMLSRRRFHQIVVLILFLGAFLPCTEAIFPKKYPFKPQEEIVKQIGATPNHGEVALYGRAIYPRYYDAGEGEPGTAKIGYEPNGTARLVFFLVGAKNELVVFELEEAPGFFPHASDVFLIGTQTENYFSPRIVKVIKNSQSELYINK